MLVPKNVKSIIPVSGPVFITKVLKGSYHSYPTTGHLHQLGEKVTFGDADRYDYHIRYLGYGIFEETISEMCKVEYK